MDGTSKSYSTWYGLKLVNGDFVAKSQLRIKGSEVIQWLGSQTSWSDNVWLNSLKWKISRATLLFLMVKSYDGFLDQWFSWQLIILYCLWLWIPTQEWEGENRRINSRIKERTYWTWSLFVGERYTTCIPQSESEVKEQYFSAILLVLPDNQNDRILSLTVHIPWLFDSVY